MLYRMPPRCDKRGCRKIHIRTMVTRITESLLFIIRCDCCEYFEERAWGLKPAIASATRHIKKEHDEDCDIHH